MKLHNLAIAVAIVGLLAVFTARPAHADTITLNASSSGTINVTGNTDGTYTVVFSSTVSGGTSTGGTYSFNNVGTITFSSCTTSGGCTANTGTSGTLTVNGITYSGLTFTLLDGDGQGVTFKWTATGLSSPNDMALNTNDTFTGLYQSGLSTGDVGISSGEINTVPEPSTLGMLAIGLLAVGLAGSFVRWRELCAV